MILPHYHKANFSIKSCNLSSSAAFVAGLLLSFLANLLLNTLPSSGFTRIWEHCLLQRGRFSAHPERTYPRAAQLWVFKDIRRHPVSDKCRAERTWCHLFPGTSIPWSLRISPDFGIFLVRKKMLITLALNVHCCVSSSYFSSRKR